MPTVVPPLYRGAAFAARSSACISLVALVAGCTATPSITREKMTLGEANIEGLVCRKDKAPDTNIPRTICASAEAWALFDERRLRETADLLAEGRKYTNVGRFNRD